MTYNLKNNTLAIHHVTTKNLNITLTKENQSKQTKTEIEIQIKNRNWANQRPIAAATLNIVRNDAVAVQHIAVDAIAACSNYHNINISHNSTITNKEKETAKLEKPVSDVVDNDMFPLIEWWLLLLLRLKEVSDPYDPLSRCSF